MLTTTKIVPAKAVRYAGAVNPEPKVWSFRKAERGELTIGPEGLFFGSWSIPTREVTEAHWFTAREMPVSLVAILRVRLRAEVFEFAIEPWRLSLKELPFRVERLQFSIVSRRLKLLVAASLAAGIAAFALAG